MADIKLYGKLVANTEEKTVVDTTSVQDVSKNQKLNVTLENIEKIIPSTATASNQLADQTYVGNTIDSTTGVLITNNGDSFTSLTQLNAYTGPKKKFDYAYVVDTDADGNKVFSQYLYDGSAWVFQYTVDSANFSETQWDAINSGITSTIKDTYDAHIANTVVHVTQSDKDTWSAKQDALVFDNIPTENSSNPVRSSGIYSSIENVREVAEGKTQTYVVSDVTNAVFNSHESVVTTTNNLVDINGNTIVLSNLHIGDTIYVVEVDVPDRWVSDITQSGGVYTIQFAKLETAKVPVSDVRVNGTSVVTNQIANVTIPTDISAFTQDSTHRLVTDAQITDWSAKQNAISSSNMISSDYVDDTNATNKFATASQLAQIATNTSDISTNATNIATNTNNISANTTAISGIKDGTDIDSFADVETALADKQDVLTEGNGIIISNDEISIDTSVVATQADLPEGEIDIVFNGTPTASSFDLTNIVVGDVTYTNPAQTNYVAGTGISLTDVSQGKQISVDTNTIQTKIDSSNKISSDNVDDTNATNLFVTSTDKTTWNGKQDALVSGTNIKTINNETILGSGNIVIATNKTFPNTWTTTGTINQFCANVDADATAVAGMSFLGELRCSDLPAGLANVEAIVEIMEGTGTSNKTIHIAITSGNLSPYRWDYTYWSGGLNTSGWISYLPTKGGTMSGDIKLPYTSKLVCNDGSTMMYGENDGSGVTIGNGVRSAATVTLVVGDTESAKVQRGSSAAATKYNILDAYNTQANPTLAGTETNLTSLKLNGTDYAISGGTQVTFVDWS